MTSTCMDSWKVFAHARVACAEVEKESLIHELFESFGGDVADSGDLNDSELFDWDDYVSAASVCF